MPQTGNYYRDKCAGSGLRPEKMRVIRDQRRASPSYGSDILFGRCEECESWVGVTGKTDATLRLRPHIKAQLRRT